MENVIEKPKKKRGPKPKNQPREYEINESQTKFVVDVRGDEKNQERIIDLLKEANRKSYGREIDFHKLATFALEKFDEDDLQELKASSVTPQEKLRKYHKDYMQTHGVDISFEDYLLIMVDDEGDL